MKAKTVIDLLSLSVSLYMLSRDHDFLKKSVEKNAGSKRNAEDGYEADHADDYESEDEFISGILHNVERLKEGLERKLDEVAAAVYGKMHITHTNEIKKLADEIASLRTELALTEAKVVNLQQSSV